MFKVEIVIDNWHHCDHNFMSEVQVKVCKGSASIAYIYKAQTSHSLMQQ